MRFGPASESMVTSFGCLVLPDALLKACKREGFELNRFIASTEVICTS